MRPRMVDAARCGLSPIKGFQYKQNRPAACRCIFLPAFCDFMKFADTVYMHSVNIAYFSAAQHYNMDARFFRTKG